MNTDVVLLVCIGTWVYLSGAVVASVLPMFAVSFVVLSLSAYNFHSLATSTTLSPDEYPTPTAQSHGHRDVATLAIYSFRYCEYGISIRFVRRRCTQRGRGSNSHHASYKLKRYLQCLLEALLG